MVPNRSWLLSRVKMIKANHHPRDPYLLMQGSGYIPVLLINPGTFSHVTEVGWYRLKLKEPFLPVSEGERVKTNTH